MADDRIGMSTALAEALQQQPAGDDAQGALFADADDAPMPMAPVGARAAGRPKGARNRSTEQWRQYLASRYTSPLVVLAEMWSQSPTELAKKLGLEVWRRDSEATEGGSGKWVPDVAAAVALQKEAAIASLPYWHQKQPLAIEAKGERRGLLVIGDLTVNQGVADGGQIPFAQSVENQQVIEAVAIASDGRQSDER